MIVRKVDVLVERETPRIEKDIAALEKSIQDDRDFLKTSSFGGHGNRWRPTHAAEKGRIRDNLPAKEKHLEELRGELQILQM